MNKFSEQLLQAFDIAMNEATSKLRYDKTIQARVIEVKDLDTGEYKVEYNDGIISAYAIDPSEVYKVDEYVYVTVPEGDFSNKKFIQYRITGNSLSTAQTNQLQNMIIEVSPNFSELGYTYVQGEQGLCIGSPLPDEIDLLGTPAADASARFLAYANEYEYLRIGASFREEFVEDHAIGDFGICVIFKNEANEDVPYFLNVSDFNGDPYHLLTWSPQTAIVHIPKGELKSLSAVKFYEKDFESEGNAINLFVKDLSLSFVEIRDLTEIPYYLSIIPTNGITFTDNLSSIVLQGRIIHYGEVITSGNCLYQWYSRDLSIEPGTEGYDKRAGWGWKAIDGAISAEYTVAKTSVPWKQRYKLLAIYNDDTLMEDEITLSNSSSSINLSIIQVTNNNGVTLRLSDNNYTGDWYYLSSDGHPEFIASGTSVNITDYLLYAPLSFYCQVYLNSTYIGELSYLMQNMTSEEDLTVIFEGEDVFCYDGNGAIDPLGAQRERRLTAWIVKNRADVGIKSIEWIDPKGRIIGNESGTYEYKDMIQSARIKAADIDLEEKIVYYTINQRYNLDNAQNIYFTIRVTTLNNESYEFKKQLQFTKTGDPGTNGTRYTSLIKITSANKFVGSTRTVTLTCYVYKDSYQFDQASVSWNLIGVTTSSGESFATGASVTVKASGNSNIRYAKATIRINANGESTTFYNFFPVDTSSATSTVDLSGLPQYIQYDTNGINPQYYKYGLSSISGTITSETPTLITVTANRELKVADVFNPTNPVGLIKIVQGNTTFYHPIPMYINAYGNEAINGWDGVELEIDAQGRYIYSPQVGAGTKDNQNRFTGVVMGKDSQQIKNGLYGYKQGINTFGLTEDGLAYFGVENDGRITLNGTNATITGGDGGNSDNGMTITLAATTATSDAIRVGNENFVVKYNGNINATSADIQGTITASTGYIGRTSRMSSDGWTIATNRISSGMGSNYVALDSGTENVDYAIWAGATTPNQGNEKFSVQRNGTVFMRDANIKGTLHVKQGYIGCTYNSTTGAYSDDGWVISTNTISSGSGNSYVALASNGTYAIWAGNATSSSAPFSVTHAGKLTASNAVISGSITATSGKIGNWNVTKYLLYSGTTYLLGSNELYWLVDRANHTIILTSGTKYYTNNGLSANEATSTGQEVTLTSYSTSSGWYSFKFKTGSDTTTTYYSAIPNFAISSSDTSTTDYYRIWAGSSTASSAKFSVTDSGVVKASDANITGTITAKTGYIGWSSSSNKGWEITANKISSNAGTQESGNNNARYVALASNGIYAIWAGHATDSSAPFSVTHQGKLKATSATISGAITATSGTIGNWNINTNSSNRLESSATNYGSRIYLDGSATGDSKALYISYTSSTPTADTTYTNSGNGWFYVTANGKLYAQAAEIRGTIKSKSGEIGGWTLEASKLYSNSRKIGMSSSGIEAKDSDNNSLGYFTFWSGGTYTAATSSAAEYIKLGSSGTYFAVTTSGKLYCREAEVAGKITSTEGSIGGWTISANGLSNGNNIYLKNDGSMQTGSNFKVDSSGNVTLGGSIKLNGTITWNGNNPAAGCLTDETIAKQISKGTYTAPTATFINGTTIAAPIIKGGSIYGTTFYATQNNDTKYLTVTSNGIQYWDTTFSSNYSIWRLENKQTPVGQYDEVELIATNRSFSLSCEARIDLTCGQSITLDPGTGATYINKAVIYSASYSTSPPSGAGSEGQLYFVY